MVKNQTKYENEVKELISEGQKLYWALQKECHPINFEKQYKEALTSQKYKTFVSALPRFSDKYQTWYSETLSVIKQLTPDRLDDFKKLYEKPKSARKEITYENYTIEDALFGLTITRGYQKDKVVDPSAAIVRMEQQLAILKSVKQRLNSSLFDIKQLLQVDLLDSEIDAAEELLKKGFLRAAGAVTGVVLEAHLAQVADNHNVKPKKKNPSISDWNDLLKDAEVIETPDWRKIQHLGDLRNLCDHKKKVDPSREDVEELIKGVNKIIKNLF